YRYDSQNHLIEVTGPAITQTTMGGPLIPENQFPNGRSEIYAYTSGHSDERLNHKMTLIVAPNQAAGVADGSLEDQSVLGPLARVANVWNLDSASPDAGRLVSLRVGNAAGTEGGTYKFNYTQVTPLGVDPINDEVEQISVLDRAGNLSDHFINIAG